MKVKRSLMRTAAALAIAGAMLPAMASAQQAAQPTDQTTDLETGAAVVEDSQPSTEIVVTATKRAAGLQDVPISILAIEAERLTERGVVSTAQLPTIAPGISFTLSGETKLNSFTIRGVGTYAQSAALEPAVGVAVDGVPLARIGGGLSDLVDIERVEVLRGPQGTLFGKNATAGVISIVTSKPEIGRTLLKGNISYGSFNELNVDGTANLELAPNAALRVTAWRFGHDGFVLGTDGRKYNDKNSYGARLGLAVDATEDLRFTFIGEYSGRDQEGDIATIRQFLPGAGPAAIVTADAIARGIVPSPKNLVGGFGPDVYNKGDAFYFTGLLDWDIGGGYTVSSVSSYRNVRSRTQFDPFVTSSTVFGLKDVSDDEKYDQFTQELRIASPEDQPLSFVAGLFYYDFTIQDKQLQSFYGIITPGVTYYSRRNTVKNTLTDYAVFGEATFRLTSSLRLIGGLRYSHDKVTGSFDRAPGRSPDVAPVPPSVPLFHFVPKDTSFDFLSWRAGAQFDVGRDVMLYATASRGYKAPGYNLTQSLTPSNLVDDARVGAEKAISYEAGIRSQFFDRHLTINLSGFLETFDDFQTSVGVSVVGPPVFVIQNAKQLKSSGIELDITARPADGLSLGFSGAYVDARYTNFRNAPCYTGEPTLPAGSPLTPGFCVNGTQSVDGLPLATSPKWSFNIFARYDADVSSDWRVFGQVDYNYRSSVIYEAQANPLERQGGFGILNATLGFGPSSRAWSLTGYIRNITDQNYVDRVRANPWNLYQYPAYLGRRQVGATFSFRF